MPVNRHAATEAEVPQAENEENSLKNFFEVFTRPFQVYSILKKRSQQSPLFLTRNLSYMKHRMSRKNEARHHFKVDKILERKLAEIIRPPKVMLTPEDTLSITLYGIFDRSVDSSKNLVEMKVSLQEGDCKKWSDIPPVNNKVAEWYVVVPINPREVYSNPGYVTIHMDVLQFDNTKCYFLNFQVNCSNTDTLTKALKESWTCKSQLQLSDQRGRTDLLDGDYEIILKSTHLPVTNKSKEGGLLCNDADDESTKSDEGSDVLFHCEDMLKMKLSWLKTPRKALESIQANQPTEKPAVTEKVLKPLVSVEEPSTLNKKSKGKIPIQKRSIYEFTQKGKRLQYIDSRNDVVCPWCSLECGMHYPLLKHLRLCHPRMWFFCKSYSERTAVIKVLLNVQYESMLEEDLPDMIIQPPSRFKSRHKICKVTCQLTSEVLVGQPYRPLHCLSEFHQSNVYDMHALFTAGLNRVHYSDRTWLPLTNEEVKTKAATPQPTPEWMKQLSVFTMDDFTDVNEGEKEIMKMWNLFVLDQPIIAESQLKQSCLKFIREKGIEILEKNIYCNFLLHLCCMHDLNMISAEDIWEVVKALQETALGVIGVCEPNNNNTNVHNGNREMMCCKWLSQFKTFLQSHALE